MIRIGGHVFKATSQFEASLVMMDECFKHWNGRISFVFVQSTASVLRITCQMKFNGNDGSRKIGSIDPLAFSLLVKPAHSSPGIADRKWCIQFIEDDFDQLE